MRCEASPLLLHHHFLYVDVLGDAKADRYKFALDTVSKDPNVDGVIVVLTPQAMTEIKETAQAVCDLATEYEKPILACFMGEKRVKAGVDILVSNSVPNYPFPNRAATALKAMSDYQDILSSPEETFETVEVDKQTVRDLIDMVSAQPRG